MKILFVSDEESRYNFEKLEYFPNMIIFFSASVLVPLCVNESGKAGLLFTKRTTKLRSHSGQVKTSTNFTLYIQYSTTTSV